MLEHVPSNAELDEMTSLKLYRAMRQMVGFSICFFKVLVQRISILKRFDDIRVLQLTLKTGVLSPKFLITATVIIDRKRKRPFRVFSDAHLYPEVIVYLKKKINKLIKIKLKLKLKY